MFAILFNPTYVFYWNISNLRALPLLDNVFLFNIALYYSILIILQIYILSFSQFRPSVWPFHSTLIKNKNLTKSTNVKLIFSVRDL